MKWCYKYGVILIFLLIFYKGNAQVLEEEHAYNSIKAEFVKENIQIKPREVFFNVLKIVNQSNRPRFVNLQYETPVGWNLITDRESRINLDPNDSIFVPLRASANKNVKGEIGYSIIASITTRTGQPVTTAYCFIKVPRNSELNFIPLTRVSYIDQKTQTGTFSFKLNNSGNVDEVINLEFTSTPNLRMKGEVNNLYSTEFTIPSKTDTVLTYDVIVDEPDIGRSLFRINLNGFTEKSKFNSTFWFKNITSSYQYTKPSGEVPLIVNLNLENLFSEYGSYFSGRVNGNILFKDSKEFNYFFYKYSTQREGNFLKSSRIYLNYLTPDLKVQLGDQVNFNLRTGLGRGAMVNYKLLSNLEVGGKYSYHIFDPINNYGFNTRLSNPAINIKTTFEYSDDQLRNRESVLGKIGTNFKLSDSHKLRTDFAVSDYADNQAIDFNNLGYHHSIDYSGNINKLNFLLRNRYNSDTYYGGFYGKNEIIGNANLLYKKGWRFNFALFSSNIKPTFIMADNIDNDNYRIRRNVSTRVIKQLSNTISVYSEPIYSYYKSNSFYQVTSSKPFITHSGYLRIGSILRFDTYSRLSISFKGGLSQVTQYTSSDNLPQLSIDDYTLEDRRNAFNAVFDLAYNSRKWGAFFKYFHGPYNGNQFFNYFYNGSYSQLLRVMPYYRDYLYKDIIEFDSRLNYMYSIDYRTHRINWGNEVLFHLNYGVLLKLIGTFTFQSSMGEEAIRSGESNSYTYSNTYIELRLEKRFDWNQPRVKYHDLEVFLYKDLNGNLKKDYNEPGVQNVLVEIEKLDPAKIDSIDDNYEYSGSLVNNRLLSGMGGTISYSNIPEGVYKVKIQDVGGETGQFSPDQQEVITHINQNRDIYIPFLERNKIFGKIILNRSKLSNMGEVDVSNVKITAVDSKGRKISTLTDSRGNFTLFAPSVDLYNVSVNNIFRDHFDLRKNNYRVQLNGYKQFEVNFIFDEKRRRINFTPSFAEDDIEVQSVKRTNMTGVVKDESTLQPVRASIEIVDNTTGSTVETTNSDRQNGRFSMSFMTGSNYSMIVTAPGYWFYNEKLNLDQMLTIQDIEKEVLLRNIIIGSKIELNNLRFEPGSTEIPNDAYPELDRLIEQLKQNPNVRIQISGHSDALETLENENLSVERAKEVAKYMMQNGFSNIEYVGYKDKQPVAPNDSQENRARNRRVEVVVVDK